MTINQEKLIKIKGYTTSQIWTRKDTPAYCFLKTDNREQQSLLTFNKGNEDIPVIFRIKDWGNNWTIPPIKKGSYLEIKGHWATNKEAPPGCLMRKSFTVYSYQLLNQEKENIFAK